MFSAVPMINRGKSDTQELNINKSQKHATAVRETLDTLLAASIEEFDTAEIEKRCKSIHAYSRLSQKSAAAQQVLSPAWERLCEVFVRLWADKEKGEFSLSPSITKADTTNNTAAEPDTAIESQSNPSNGPPRVTQVFQSVVKWLWNTTDHLESICAQVLQQGLVARFATDLSSTLFLSHMNYDADKDVVNFCMRGYMGVVFNTVRRQNLNLPLITAARDLGLVGILKEYTKSKKHMVKMKAFFLISYIANEHENKDVHPSVQNLKFMIKMVQSALSFVGHQSKIYGFHADEVLEAISNLPGCSESNVRNMLEAGLLPLLARILDGPLYDPSKRSPKEERADGVGEGQPEESASPIKPKEYSLGEKTLAAKCCWALCFNAQARTAIASIPMLSAVIAKYANESEDPELKRAAAGCLWELAEGIQVLGSEEKPEEKPELGENSKELELAESEPDDLPELEQDMNKVEQKKHEEEADAVRPDPATAARTLDVARAFVARPTKTPRPASSQPQPPPPPSPALRGNAPPVAASNKVTTDTRNLTGLAPESGGAAAETPAAQSAAQKKAAEPVGHLMISYNWSSKAIVKRVLASLQPLGIRIWFDEEEMRDSLVDRMAEAVEGASAVLMCYSQLYKASRDCRGEAQYAYKLNKTIIPVLCQKKYNADGWLGYLLGMLLYFDLSTEESFQENLPGLVRGVAKAMGVSVPEDATSKNQIDVPLIVRTNQNEAELSFEATDGEHRAQQSPPQTGSEPHRTPSNSAHPPHPKPQEPRIGSATFHPESPVPRSHTEPTPRAKTPSVPIPPIKRQPSARSTDAAAVDAETIERWSVADVQQWLEREKLAELQEMFQQSEVDGRLLREMRRMLERDPKFLAHVMQHMHLGLLRALRFTSVLRATVPLE